MQLLWSVMHYLVLTIVMCVACLQTKSGGKQRFVWAIKFFFKNVQKSVVAGICEIPYLLSYSLQRSSSGSPVISTSNETCSLET